MQLFFETDAPDSEEVPRPSLLCKNGVTTALLLSKFHSTDVVWSEGCSALQDNRSPCFFLVHPRGRVRPQKERGFWVANSFWVADSSCRTVWARCLNQITFVDPMASPVLWRLNLSSLPASSAATQNSVAGIAPYFSELRPLIFASGQGVDLGCSGARV